MACVVCFMCLNLNVFKNLTVCFWAAHLFMKACVGTHLHQKHKFYHSPTYGGPLFERPRCFEKGGMFWNVQEHSGPGGVWGVVFAK